MADPWASADTEVDDESEGDSQAGTVRPPVGGQDETVEANPPSDCRVSEEDLRNGSWWSKRLLAATSSERQRRGTQLRPLVLVTGCSGTEAPVFGLQAPLFPSGSGFGMLLGPLARFVIRLAATEVSLQSHRLSVVIVLGKSSGVEGCGFGFLVQDLRFRVHSLRASP